MNIFKKSSIIELNEAFNFVVGSFQLTTHQRVASRHRVLSQLAIFLNILALLLRFFSSPFGDFLLNDFRKRLLHGREEMFASLPSSPGGIWVDLGAGTGENAENWGPRLNDFSKAYLVDLSSSLLKIADQRIEARGWKNVETVHADATKFVPPEGYADVVTCSYSLTMIPDWFLTMDQAYRMLKPGGTFGVVDFFVARKWPADGLKKHAWSTRTMWPTWFANDNVFLSPDHIPYLQSRFETVSLNQDRGKVPYMPFVRAPYYRFVGRKSAES